MAFKKCLVFMVFGLSCFWLFMLMNVDPLWADEHNPLTYYVSPEGNDSNDGLSEQAPLRDLANAIYRMKLGDTLIVLPGDYDMVEFRAWCQDPYKDKMYLGPEGGNAAIRTTIKGKAGEPRPKVKALTSDGTIGMLQFNGAVGITVEHLDIWGGLGYGRHMFYRDLVVGGQGVTYAISGEHHNALIEDCYFHDIHGGSDAIGIYISGDDNVIRNNFFRNMGHHAINSNKHGYGEDQSPSERWIIEGNYITETNGHGIGLQNTQDFVIRNNVLVNVGSQAISFGGDKFPDHRVTVVGNTIYNGEGKGFYGLFFINDVEGLVVKNNLMVHNSPVAFLHPETQLTPEKLSTYTFRNNLYYNPYRDGERVFFPNNDPNNFYSLPAWQEYTAQITGGQGMEQGSVYGDSQVISPPVSGSDYLEWEGASHIDLRPADGSPLIDAGVETDRLSRDADGKLRPQGENYDIGAYEFPVPSDDQNPPTTPSGIEAATIGGDFIEIRWQPADDNIRVVGYVIYKDDIRAAEVGSTSHTFFGLEPGTSYEFKVAAIDAAGNSSGTTPPITVATKEAADAPDSGVGNLPKADFRIEYDKHDVSETVIFDASKSSDTEGIAKFQWNFGDNTTGNGVTTAHEYPIEGYYEVTLTIIDTDGNIATAEKDIVFYHSEPVTYYVSPDGDDLNGGLTEGTPLRDLANAIYRMKVGDTLIVLPGDYEVVDFRAWCQDPYKNKMYLGPEGGSAEIRTTIMGKPGEPKPKIQTLESDGSIGVLQFNGAVGITVEHLDIWGGLGYGRHMLYRDLVVGGQGVTYAISGEHHNALIEDCYFHDIHGGSDAIGIYIAGDDNVIRNNFFRNMGHHAINSNKHGYGEDQSPSERWIIEDNYITETNGHGIGLQNTQDFIIRNNVLVNVGSQAISFGGDKFPDHRVTVVGNTIYNGEGKGSYGLFFINDVEGLIVENNLIVHKTPVAFRDPETQLTPEKLRTYTFRNNLYYNPYRDGERVFFPTNDPNDYYGLSAWQEYTAQLTGGQGLEKGSIYGDPKVVSPPTSGSDYLTWEMDSHISVSPKADSPLIDAGVANSNLSLDILGSSRPQGDGFDIGAYEYTENSGGADEQPPTAVAPSPPGSLRIIKQ